jgi:acetate---CoA ligase (ADP-forming)
VKELSTVRTTDHRERELADPAVLQQFLHPNGVALLGRVTETASPEETVERERTRWGDRFYFVNPSGSAVGDVPVYRSLADLPEPVELAVINIGTKYLPDALEECAAQGIQNIVIFTSGFGEVGEEGRRLEVELADQVHRLGLRVLGPNTNTNTFEPMPAFALKRTRKIGLITQSGNQGRPFVQAAPYGVAISRWVTTGNELDIDVSDFISFFARDPETAVIGAYVEGFQDGAKLRAALRIAEQSRTPVVMLKMGATEAGRRMALSHTGHLTGSDSVIDGLFAQYGVTRVHDVDELIDTTNIFSKLPPRVGDRVGIYGASGGVTTLMAEIAQRHGLKVPILAEGTQRRLSAVLPAYLAHANPVDNGMKFLVQGSLEARLEVLCAIADDPEIDVIVAGNNMLRGPIAEAFVEDLVRYRALDKEVPVVCVWGTAGDNPDLFDRLNAAEIPVVRSARSAMRSLRANADYSRHHSAGASRTVPEFDDAIAEILRGREGVVEQSVARKLLDLAGITACEEHLVRTPDEAASAWHQIDSTAVMKIASSDFPHRSEHGLVRTGVESPDRAATVFAELMDRATSVQPSATIDGVIVQRQMSEGVELLIGTLSDPVLGSAVTVGFGGVLAELLADTSVRPLPLNDLDAMQMLKALRGYPLLEGIRGGPRLDIESVTRAVTAVASLMTSADGRLLEFEINPLIVSSAGAVAVDVLAVATRGEGDEGQP